MLFEVVNQLGNTVMSTQWETCVYDQDDLTSLHKAGYRFKVDGKFAVSYTHLTLPTNSRV